MKLPKLGNGGIGNFLLENFEKAIFGVVALLGLYLIYSAFTAEKFDSAKVPDKLIKEAATAKEVIRNGDWTKHKEHYPIPEGIVRDIENAQPLDSNYNIDIIREGERLQLKKRFDPVLLVAQDLEVKGVWDSFLWTEGKNKISALPAGVLRPLPEAEKPKKKKEKKKRTPRMGMGMEGEGEGESGMEGMMESMMQQEQMSEMMAMEGAMEGSGRGGPGGASAKGDKLPDAIANEMVGTRIKGGKGRFLVGGYVVCVTGVVPFKQQVIEFRKLSQTLGYDPEMDYPKYVKIDIERMDMSEPEERRTWTNITANVESLTENSFMIPPEVCAPDHLDSRLAMKATPLLRTSASEFGLHSKIPERVWFEEEEKEVEEEAEVEIDPLTNLPVVKKKKKLDPRAMSPYAPTMRPGVSSGPKMLEPAEAAEFKLVRFCDVVAPTKSYQYRVRLVLIDPNLPMSVVTGKEEKKTRGRSPMGAMGPDMEDYASQMAETDESMMEDMMGDPMGGALAIKLDHGNAKINESNLDASVRDRLTKLKKSERFELEDEDAKFGIYSDWSAPSPIVSAPRPPEKVYAGKGVRPKTRIAEGVRYTIDPPKVELAASIWDHTYKYRLPVYDNVFEGSTLNLKQTVKLIDAVDLSIRELRGEEIGEAEKEEDKKYEGYAVKSDAVVIDISPGASLPSYNKSERNFKAPTEVLVFDGDSFQLSDELIDMREYRENALYEVRDEE